MNSPLEQLEQRLLKLEEQNRRLAKSNRVFKNANISIVLIVFCLVAIGWKAQYNVADVVEAKKFVLRNDNGEILSEWKIVNDESFPDSVNRRSAIMQFGPDEDFSIKLDGNAFLRNKIILKDKPFGVTTLSSQGMKVLNKPLQFNDKRDYLNDYSNIESSCEISYDKIALSKACIDKKDNPQKQENTKYSIYSVCTVAELSTQDGYSTIKLYGKNTNKEEFKLP